MIWARSWRTASSEPAGLLEDEAEAAGAFADGREWTSSLRRMRDKLSSVPAMSEYSAQAERHA